MYRHEKVDMCTHICTDMRTDICIDMCTHIRMKMLVGMCLRMRVEMFTRACIALLGDMCPAWRWSRGLNSIFGDFRGMPTANAEG